MMAEYQTAGEVFEQTIKRLEGKKRQQADEIKRLKGNLERAEAEAVGNYTRAQELEARVAELTAALETIEQNDWRYDAGGNGIKMPGRWSDIARAALASDGSAKEGET